MCVSTGVWELGRGSWSCTCVVLRREKSWIPEVTLHCPLLSDSTSTVCLSEPSLNPALAKRKCVLTFRWNFFFFFFFCESSSLAVWMKEIDGRERRAKMWWLKSHSCLRFKCEFHTRGNIVHAFDSLEKHKCVSEKVMCTMPVLHFLLPSSYEVVWVFGAANNVSFTSPPIS